MPNKRVALDAQQPKSVSRRAFVMAVGLGALTAGKMTRHLLAGDPTDDKKPKRDRRAFAKLLARVRDGDASQSVLALLGKPDDVRRAPDRVPHPDDEIWCYGSEAHGFLATLGEVCFRKGDVVWIAGGRGQPPAVDVIGEDELCSQMRKLHPGPQAAGFNDPLHLIRVANALRRLGKKKTLAIVGEYGRIHDVGIDETWLFLLLRTLFEVPSPPGHMPDLFIGAMSPAPPDDRTLIPRFPIVIVDDIPLSLLWGIKLAGTPQGIGDHVDYFQQHGTIRTSDLRPPDDPYPAFTKLLASKEWKTMAKLTGDAHWVDNYRGHTLLQVLALCRTAHDAPEARQPFAYPQAADFDQYHKAFLQVGARWDKPLQMYVRQDGTHADVGHLAIPDR